MSVQASTAVYFIVEKHLERQATALIESLKRSGTAARRTIFALNPRRQKLSRQILRLISTCGIAYDDSCVCERYDFYPLANKIFTWSHFEEKYAGEFDCSLYLDTDTLVIRDPESVFDSLNRDRYQLAVSPVFQSRSAWLAGEKAPTLWAKLLTEFAVDRQSFWTVRSVVDTREIYAYFNSGVVFHRLRNSAFFQSLKVKFDRLMDYRHIKSLDPLSLYFLEQACLSAHIVEQVRQSDVLELPVHFNYPLEAYGSLEEQKKNDLQNVAIVHYQQLTALPAAAFGQLDSVKIADLLTEVFDANNTAGQSRRTKVAKALSFQAHKIRSIFKPLDFQRRA